MRERERERGGGGGERFETKTTNDVYCSLPNNKKKKRFHSLKSKFK